MEIRTGSSAFTDSSAGDEKVVQTYKKLGDSDADNTSDGTNRVFPVFDASTKYQYVLVWITQLPKSDDGSGYQVSVDDVSVYGY